MTEAVSRFESSLPLSSFDLVKKAAVLSGMTLKSFVAQATYNAAVDLLNKREHTLSFDEEDWAKLHYFLKHPELFDGVLERAKESTRNVGRITEKPEDRLC